MRMFEEITLLIDSDWCNDQIKLFPKNNKKVYLYTYHDQPLI